MQLSQTQNPFVMFPSATFSQQQFMAAKMLNKSSTTLLKDLPLLNQMQPLKLLPPPIPSQLRKSTCYVPELTQIDINKYDEEYEELQSLLMQMRHTSNDQTLANVTQQIQLKYQSIRYLTESQLSQLGRQLTEAQIRNLNLQQELIDLKKKHEVDCTDQNQFQKDLTTLTVFPSLFQKTADRGQNVEPCAQKVAIFDIGLAENGRNKRCHESFTISNPISFASDFERKNVKIPFKQDQNLVSTLFSQNLGNDPDTNRAAQLLLTFEQDAKIQKRSVQEIFNLQNKNDYQIESQKNQDLLKEMNILLHSQLCLVSLMQKNSIDIDSNLVENYYAAINKNLVLISQIVGQSDFLKTNQPPNNILQGLNQAAKFNQREDCDSLKKETTKTQLNGAQNVPKITTKLSNPEQQEQSLNFLMKRIRKNKLITDCPHQNEQFYSKGMCRNCYHARGRKKPSQNCEHLNRPNYALGLCKNCYLRQYHKDRRAQLRNMNKKKVDQNSDNDEISLNEVLS